MPRHRVEWGFCDCDLPRKRVRIDPAPLDLGYWIVAVDTGRAVGLGFASRAEARAWALAHGAKLVEPKRGRR